MSKLFSTSFLRVFVLGFLCLISPLFAHSPRLLIVLGPKCDFTARDLQKKVDLHVVSGTEEEMRDQINHLDSISPVHLTLIQTQIDNLPWFAHKVGYDFITLNEPLQNAVSTLLSYKTTVPVTDADLPRIDPKTVGKLYALMQKVDIFFSAHHVQYWATCGTLLGIARHKGIIPWDDDIDIAIFNNDVPILKSLESDLKKIGLLLYYCEEWGFYKIFPENGRQIINSKTNQPYPWKFPFIDIFPLVNQGNKFVYAREALRKAYPNDYFLSSELILTKLCFGPLMLPCPVQYKAYLSRTYGKDWNAIAYVTYNHEQEKSMKRVKVDLVNCALASYILPEEG